MSAVQSEDQRLRGTIRNLAYEGTDTFGFRCTTDIEYGADFTIDIQITDDGMKIASESISGPQSSVPLYNVAEVGHQYCHELQVQYNNFARGGKKPRIPCSDQQAVFTQLETPARFAGGHGKAQKVIPQVVGEYRKLLEEILFLDPNPRAMREYSFVMERTLKGDGSNLSSVLYELCIRKKQKEEVLSFIRSLPEQDIKDIDFIQTPRTEVMVKLTESLVGKIMSGTYRYSQTAPCECLQLRPHCFRRLKDHSSLSKRSTTACIRAEQACCWRIFKSR